MQGQIDGNGGYDVFLHDRVADTTLLVSRAAGATITAGNALSFQPVITADGRYVAFYSDASDLVTGMVTPNLGNVFLFDRLTGVNTLVSHRHDAPLTGSSSRSELPLISADGQVIAFQSYADDLVAGYPDWGGNGPRHAYVYDRASGTVKLLDHKHGSPSMPGLESNVIAEDISAEGRYITFAAGPDVGPPGLSSYTVYRHDRVTGENLPVRPPGVVPNGDSSRPSSSAQRPVGFLFELCDQPGSWL